MKLVIFGLTISSSWGNGHATLWRALLRALAKRGHDIVFFERDVPYYAAHRDLREIEYGHLRLYSDWSDVREEAQREPGIQPRAKLSERLAARIAEDEIEFAEALRWQIGYALARGELR